MIQNIARAEKIRVYLHRKTPETLLPFQTLSKVPQILSLIYGTVFLIPTLQILDFGEEMIPWYLNMKCDLPLSD
jgi:hypothetical protein